MPNRGKPCRCELQLDNLIEPLVAVTAECGARIRRLISVSFHLMGLAVLLCCRMLVVIARGRLIQENVLDRLNFSRVLGSYLTGQIDADFLDLKGEDDIATSDRQRLVEDDPRYLALIKFLRDTLVSIQDKWTELRNEARGKQAVTEIPALKDLLDDLPTGQRPNAQRLLGLIRGIELDPDQTQDRIDLYRSGMLAFERLRLREEAHCGADDVGFASRASWIRLHMLGSSGAFPRRRWSGRLGR